MDADQAAAAPTLGVDEPFVLKHPITEGRSADEGPLSDLMFDHPDLGALRAIERAGLSGVKADALHEMLFQIAHPWGQPRKAISRKQVDKIKAVDLDRLDEALDGFFPKGRKET